MSNNSNAELKTTAVKLMDGGEITVKEITYGEWSKTRNESTDFDNDVALIRACTGLSVDIIDNYLMPDFKDLLRAAMDLNDPDPAVTIKYGQTDIPLTSPIMTIMGDTITTAIITMPKVKAGRELDKIKDPAARINYMITATTGITNLNSMRMSDYSLLTIAVPDFFTQGAAFFRAVK